jgi:queuine/archaeosine tRNA-ribosyltransferase
MSKSKCCIGGEECSGKMMIRARKDHDYPFCTFHFNYYMNKSIKQIRQAIKENKSLYSKQY